MCPSTPGTFHLCAVQSLRSEKGHGPVPGERAISTPGHAVFPPVHESVPFQAVEPPDPFSSEMERTDFYFRNANINVSSSSYDIKLPQRAKMQFVERSEIIEGEGIPKIIVSPLTRTILTQKYFPFGTTKYHVLNWGWGKPIRRVGTPYEWLVRNIKRRFVETGR